jgi:hypothetical protein
MMLSLFYLGLFLKRGSGRWGKKPGFTERIMTVMFSKVFSFIALLDNHIRGSVGRWASPVVTLEDRCMHTFEFALFARLRFGFPFTSTNLRILL